MFSVRPRWLVSFALLVLASPTLARGADIETRDFNVLVDGKPTGEAHITIHKQEDSTIVVTSDTDILVKLLVGHYRYSFRGREIWKDNRLLRLDSTCNDDGKLYVLSATAENERLRLKVNNQEKIVRGDVWLTSYWAEPSNRLNQEVALLDADTGRELATRLQQIGVEQRTIAGQTVNVTRYRGTGKHGVTDLWYDGNNRLVRQEWTEDNHKMVLELIRLRR